MIPTFKLGSRVHPTVEEQQTNSVPDMRSLFLFIYIYKNKQNKKNTNTLKINSPLLGINLKADVHTSNLNV